ncbi:MAG: ABC transporter ATP-binding protein [Candidatus Coatesbacteria bacterium]|nr:MAG: ABC transporter ATP-binding protein [Candidatus Coatesbacteria bacterium]
MESAGTLDRVNLDRELELLAADGFYDGKRALRVEGLTKRFPQPEGKRRGFWRRRPRFAALAGVTFAVEKNEIFGLIGMNGSGKSTLIRILSTLLAPDEGEVEVFGVDVTRNPARVRELINRVAVDAAFFKVLSGSENLRYASRLYGLWPQEARGRYNGLLRRIGFEPKRLKDQVKSLSRGERQKVAVVRAFMSTPALLLLDEPTTGLDPRSKREVQRLIRDMRAEAGTTVLLTTHDMEEAERLCDRIGILHEGRLITVGTPAELERRAGGPGEAATMEDVFLKFTGAEWLADENGG